MQNQSMSNGPTPIHGQRPKRRLSLGIKFLRIEMFTVLLGIALLLVAVALYAGLSSPNAESKQINTKEYQAVFITNTLGGGIQTSVYFGKISELNNKYLILKNVFYISPASNEANTQNQNTNYTLVKLGVNELHQPEDAMIINRDAVTFWENLKDTSQVVTKIKEYYKNPGAASTTPSNGTTQTVPSTTTPTKPAGQ